MTAGELTTASSPGSYDSIYTWSGTPAVGDKILVGLDSFDPQLATDAVYGGGPFALDYYPYGSHFQFNYQTVGSINAASANNKLSIAGDWYHRIVSMYTVTAADGTSGSIKLRLNCDPSHTIYDANPFFIYIPASANIPAQEVARWQRQLLHGAVPASWNHPGVAVTREPIASVPTATVMSGTSGTATCSQGIQGTQKYASCYLNNYAHTGTAQTYMFPAAYNTTPVLLESGGTCGSYNPSVSATALTLPANASMTAETCNVVVLGQ